MAVEGTTSEGLTGEAKEKVLRSDQVVKKPDKAF